MFVPLPIKSMIEVIPKKMVTHNWSNLFRDLVATVIADALGEHAFEFVAELLCDKHGVKFCKKRSGCMDVWRKLTGSVPLPSISMPAFAEPTQMETLIR